MKRKAKFKQIQANSRLIQDDLIWKCLNIIHNLSIIQSKLRLF
jgi:hypothetical protein